MSRIGNKPISVPDGVKLTLSGRTVNVEGPVGKLSWTYRSEVSVALEDDSKTVVVTRGGDDRFSRALHGLTRSLIANMVNGCLNATAIRLVLRSSVPTSRPSGSWRHEFARCDRPSHTKVREFATRTNTSGGRSARLLPAPAGHKLDLFSGLMNQGMAS